ncbi:head-tail connector protein [Serratia symbiotica]|uniref:head-tail connector protein n=1 Tax=Serratia symbiotica TaxID=138074 RepID=UPI0011F39328
MFIDKAQVKRQFRIELDDNSEDVLLENYIATAEQKTIAHLNRNLYVTSRKIVWFFFE